MRQVCFSNERGFTLSIRFCGFGSHPRLLVVEHVVISVMCDLQHGGTCNVMPLVNNGSSLDQQLLPLKNSRCVSSPMAVALFQVSVSWLDTASAALSLDAGTLRDDAGEAGGEGMGFFQRCKRSKAAPNKGCIGINV